MLREVLFPHSRFHDETTLALDQKPSAVIDNLPLCPDLSHAFYLLPCLLLYIREAC